MGQESERGDVVCFMDFQRRIVGLDFRLLQTSKTDAIENAFAEAAAEFAQGRGAEISAHSSLFTNNYEIVVAHRIARKEKQKPSAATLSTPCLENKSESLV